MTKKQITLIAVDVINGDYGTGDARVKALKKKGYNPKAIQDEVNRLMTQSKKKSIDTLAHEVIDGLWRSGKKREKVLKACKCNYDKIQKRVNEILNPDPKPDPKGHYTGKYPSIRIVKTNAQVIEDTIIFARWIANYNLFHYGWGKEAHHNGCFFCGTQPSVKKRAGIKEWKTTYCCNPYIHACFAHGGCVTSMLSLCRKGGSFGFKRGEGYDTSALFDSLGKPSMGKLKPGDVMCSNDHVAILLDKGQFAEATGIDNNIPYSQKWNDSIAVKTFDKKEYDYYTRVYRFNGAVDSEYPIRYGEVSDRVGDLQKYLNWYGNYGLTVDREFGEASVEAFEDLQKKEGLVVDGECGAKSIAKMREVVR